MQGFKEIEEYDKLKTKVLKYVLYKKRTEQEIWQKFAEYESETLNEIIDYLKENNYIDDKRYIEKAVKEFMALKNMSIKELKYKLLSKGLKSTLIDDYISLNKEELEEFELNSANRLYLKKQREMQEDEIINYLRKKGYKEETIRSIQNNE